MKPGTVQSISAATMKPGTVQPISAATHDSTCDWMRVRFQASHEGEPLFYKGETTTVDTEDENVWRNQSGFTGTPVKYKTVVGEQAYPNVTEAWHSITIMREYLNRKSFEELRLEDYESGKVKKSVSAELTSGICFGNAFTTPLHVSSICHPVSKSISLGGFTRNTGTTFLFGQSAGNTQTHPCNFGTTASADSSEGNKFSDQITVEESMSQTAYSSSEPTVLQFMGTAGSGEQFNATKASQVRGAADESSPVQQQREKKELLNALFYTQLKCLQIQQSLHHLVLLKAEQLQTNVKTTYSNSREMNSVEKGPVSSVRDVLQKPFEAMAIGITRCDDKEAVSNLQVGSKGVNSLTALSMSGDGCCGQTLVNEDVATLAEELQKPLEAMLKTSEIQVALHRRLFSLCTEYMADGGEATLYHTARSAQTSHGREVLVKDTDEILAYAEAQFDGINFKQSLPCSYYRDPFQACRVLASSSDKLEEVPDFNVFTPAGSAPAVRSHILQPHGQGVLATQTGQVMYDGQWRDGKRFGKGKAFIVHVTEDLILNKKKSGYYEGQWRENMRHGQGRMVFLSSASYEGGWQYDAIEGNGCQLYPDGCTLEGEWIKGLINGRGIFTWPDGVVEYREYTMGEARRPSSKMDPGKETFFRKVRNVESRLKYTAQTVHEMKEELQQFAEVANSVRKDLREELDCVKNLLSDISEEHARKLAQAEESFSSALKEEKRNLEKRLEEANRARLCQICFENNRDCIIMPCTHMLFCRKCVANVKLQGSNRCPTCRGPISGEINCNLGMES